MQMINMLISFHLFLAIASAETYNSLSDMVKAGITSGYCILGICTIGKCLAESMFYSKKQVGSSRILFKVLDLNDVCVQCIENSDCSNGKICLNYQCIRCKTDSECKLNSAQKPYCVNLSGLNYCRECYQNAQCTSDTNSFCSKEVCSPCQTDSHCSHIAGAKKHCFSGRCVECNLNTDCTLGSTCNTITNHCQGSGCSNHNDCSSTPEKPICTHSFCSSCGSDPTFCSSKGLLCSPNGSCKTCWTNQNCDSPSLSQCVNDSCQKCSIDDHCSHIQGKTKCSISKGCVECIDSNDCSANEFCNASNQCQFRQCQINQDCISSSNSICDNFICKPCKIDHDCSHLGSEDASYLCRRSTCVVRLPPLSITLSYTNSAYVYLVEFPHELVQDIDVISASKIQLFDVNADFYTYKLVKITKTSYEIHFDVRRSISATKLQITYTDLNNTYSQSEWYSELQTKRMPYITEDQKEICQTIQTAGQVVTAAMGSTCGLMMVIGGNPALLWAMIGLLQTFYYLIFINVNYPANVQIFLKIFAIGGLDFIPNPLTYIISGINNLSLPVPSRFEEYDINGLFLVNVGNLLFLWAVVCFVFGFASLANRYFTFLPKLAKTICFRIVLWFKWSGVLRALITTYGEIAQASFLQIRTLDFDSIVFGFSSGFGIVFAVFSVAFPIITSLIIHKSNKNPSYLRSKYRVLVENYTLERVEPKYFIILFLLRQLALNLSLVFFHDYAYAQITCLTIISILTIFLGMKYRPFRTKSANIVRPLCEFFYSIVHVLIFVLIHDDHVSSFSEEVRLEIGWAIIISSGIILMINMGVSLFEQLLAIRKLWLFLKNLWKKYRDLKVKNCNSKKINIPRGGKLETNIESQHTPLPGLSLINFAENSQARINPLPRIRRRRMSPKTLEKLEYLKGINFAL